MGQFIGNIDKSVECEAYGNSPPPTSLSTTYSTQNAASTTDRILSSTAPALSPSGVNLVQHKGQLRFPARDEFELVLQHPQ